MHTYSNILFFAFTPSMDFAFMLFVLSTVLISVLWRQLKSANKTRYTQGNELDRRASEYMKTLPMPPSLPLLGNVHHMLRPGFNPFKQATDWVGMYGPVFRLTALGEQIIFLADPVIMQKVLGSTNPKYLNKYQRVYSAIFTGHMTTGIIGSEYDLWNLHRRIMNRSFSYKSLQNHLSVVNKYSKELVADIQGTCYKEHNNDPSGICEMIHYMTMKLILHTMMDTETSSDKLWECFHQQYEMLKDIAGHRVLHPWLLIGPVWRLHPLYNTQTLGIQQVDSILEKAVTRCKSVASMTQRNSRSHIDKTANVANDDKDSISTGGTRDTICMIMEWAEAGMSHREIQDEVMTILVAGHDTTSWALKLILFRLAIEADIQEKCREEVDKLFESKRHDDDNGCDLDITMDDLTNLKYLERCIMENLRLWPILPFIAKRLDAPLEVNENMVLPEGDILLICIWALHRDPNTFPDSEKFDPDRFLPENCRKRHPYSYVPFSAGTRNCIGWKTALMTIKAVTAFILRNFVVETAQKLEDLEFQFQVSVSIKGKLSLILKKRASDEK